MTDLDISPLYDTQLETVLDSEAVCYASDGPAVARAVSPCGCDSNLCETHYRASVDRRDQCIQEGILLSCRECGVTGFDPLDVRIYPI